MAPSTYGALPQPSTRVNPRTKAELHHLTVSIGESGWEEEKDAVATEMHTSVWRASCQPTRRGRQSCSVERQPSLPESDVNIELDEDGSVADAYQNHESVSAVGTVFTVAGPSQQLENAERRRYKTDLKSHDFMHAAEGDTM